MAVRNQSRLWFGIRGAAALRSRRMLSRTAPWFFTAGNIDNRTNLD